MALLHGFLDRRSLRRKQRYYTKISAAYSRSNVKSRLHFSSKGILNLILNRKKFFRQENGALDKQKTAANAAVLEGPGVRGQESVVGVKSFICV